jgi:hypothetical protein
MTSPIAIGKMLIKGLSKTKNMAMPKTQTMDLEIRFIVTWDSPKQAR